MFESEYKSALNFTARHYENFPVVSLFVPANLRKHVAVIYQFARMADDIADEGKLSADDRLVGLKNYELSFSNSLIKRNNEGFWAALNHTIEEFKLTHENFYKLISAFRQDVIKKRFENFGEILDYCSNSANPVGRIILELNNVRDEQAFRFSDKICTALQLTNFYQDVAIDFRKGRIYIPQDELEDHNVKVNVFEESQIDHNFKKCMMFQIDRAQNYFDEGKSLLDYLDGRLKMQIKWTIFGGEEILSKIKKNDYNVLQIRPKLTKLDYFRLMIKSLFL
ncbi:MAG: squalene synthase HpnC [Melioribacteraceae bacterium]|nr:squalene synthase HpnC [Melioribacteraceae bacterium]MCF8354617.1 squalene synthase HpnC [Melioribacteraceae bacterium]MCF8395005.1 squalene synthase HpnC [Melioribacteraceae bacterium]MCF8418891.1 squalene synthase HpnC [Melioribacteraceae bacterium]